MERAIPFLDFDVIYGAIPSLARTRLLSEVASDNELVVYNLPGPHSLNSLLGEGMVYCLPPGTMIELIGKASSLKSRSSERSKKLLGILKQATTDSDPLRLILTSYNSHSLAEIIQEEFHSLGNSLGDLGSIDSVLSRSMPIEDLVDPAGIDEKEMFNDAYKELTHYRPTKRINNSNDALNIATVVHVLRRARSGARTTNFPVFISQTKNVLGLDAIVKKALGSDIDGRFQILNTFQYLTISERLALHCGKRHHVVAEQSSLLEKNIGSLGRAYERLVNAIGSGQVKYDDTESAEWSTLRLRRCEFDLEWGWLLERPRQAAIQDRLAFLNAFSLDADEKTEFRGLIDSTEEDPKRALGVINKTIGILERSLANRLGGPEVILTGSLGADPVAPARMSLGSLFTFSYLRIPEDQGALLMDTGIGSSFDSSILADENELRTGIRIFVHPRILQHMGVLLSVDLKREANGELFVVITWPHTAAARTFFKSAAKVLKRLAGVEMIAAKAKMRTYYEGGTEDVAEVSCEQLNESVLKLRRGGYGASCLEIYNKKVSLFVDLAPIRGVELQAGLTLRPFGDLDSVLDSTAELLASTSKHRNVLGGSCLYRDLLVSILENVDGKQRPE
jgi:hypothetical protein